MNSPPLMVSNKLYAALKVSLKLYDLNEYNEYKFRITTFLKGNKYLMLNLGKYNSCNFLRGMF